MWGYAEGNATLVGIVVVLICAAAVIYVVRSATRHGPRPPGGLWPWRRGK